MSNNSIIFVRITVKKLRERAAQHSLASRTKELQSRRTKLSKRITKLFEQQSTVMPTVTRSTKSSNIEDTILYLPSDFTAKERLDLNLECVAREEKILREGELVDALSNVREAAQYLSCMRSRKKKTARGQRQNMRDESKCVEQEHLLDDRIAHYNYARQRLLKLTDDDPRFPPLSTADTFRKSPDIRRQLGDSVMPDGRLWAIRAPTLAAMEEIREEKDEEGIEEDLFESSEEDEESDDEQSGGNTAADEVSASNSEHHRESYV
jgi:hypothetical protein